MKKSFEDKIRALVRQKEREDKCTIIAVDVVRTRKIGFKDNSEIKVTYYTND